MDDLNIAQNADYFASCDWFRLGQPTTTVEGVSYIVTEDLTEEPITVDFLKQQCRIDFNDDQALLTQYIKAARQYLEGWSQLSFGVKTIRFMAMKLPNRWGLVNGPYTAINTVDSGFTLFGNTLIRDGYRYNNRPSYDVDIELTTGWPNDLLPENVKLAVAKQAAWFYISRESIVTSDEGAIQRHQILDDESKMLLNPLRAISWP